MPRSRGKLKIQWIVENASRNATFRKRRATLLEKAKELSTLCKIPVAVVVYGPGNAEPASWPELEEAKKIMQKYLALPEASKVTRRLDNEGLLCQGLKKVGKRFESCKASTRQLEVNLLLNDISLGRRSNLDDLPPEIAVALRSEVDLLRSSIYERLNSLTSAAAAAVLVSSQQEPLAMAPPMVANAPLLVQPPALEPDLLLVPPEEPLMAPPPEPPMVPPFAMAPPMLADVPVLLPHALLAAAGEPLAAAAAGVGVNEDDGFPRNGSYLLEVADAILDDGRSGHAVQATDDDVDRLLREHGLESFIKPKP